MRSDSDRVLIESLVAQDSPQELGVFYADEVPDGASEEGFRFVMDLCQFRVYKLSLRSRAWAQLRPGRGGPSDLKWLSGRQRGSRLSSAVGPCLERGWRWSLWSQEWWASHPAAAHWPRDSTSRM